MAGQASPEAMDRMISNLTKCIQAQQSVAAALKNDYRTVGEEWNDKQYENLGVVIESAVRDLSSNYASLSESISKLQILKQKLMDYLEHHIA